METFNKKSNIFFLFLFVMCSQNISIILVLVLFSNVYGALDLQSSFTKDLENWAFRQLSILNITLDDNFGLDIYKFLRKYGYPVETHWVRTEDNYVLRMHRIPHGKNNLFANVENKPAVLLMHGISGSSMHYVDVGVNRSIAMALADAGFDVWLGNNRGNTWSRQHIYLDPDIDTDFWDFSYEKCGIYDLPAKIDYIIENTGLKKIFYIGHSQGTTEFLVMASMRPEYNDKIALATLLAPIAYMGDMRSVPLRILSLFLDPLVAISDLLTIHEIMSYSSLGSTLRGISCADGSPLQDLCVFGIFILNGFDDGQLNRSILSTYFSNSPNGVSKNMYIHYGQNIVTGNFQRYNYGNITNRKIYGDDIPPNFNLSLITAPVSLFYAQNDFFSMVEAVERLASELPNVVKKTFISYEYWNHVDYVLARDVKKYVNDPVIAHQKEIIANGGLNLGDKTSTAVNLNKKLL